MASFSIDISVAVDIEDQLRTAQRRIANDLNELEGIKMDGWDGEAKANYLQCQAKWRDAADKMTANLELMAMALGRATDNYSNAEKSVARSWGG